jgi:hypothetical protein
MMKLVSVASLAAVFCVPEAAAQSVVQRSDWQDRKFDTYLPRVNTSLPWLEIDTKTKLPKGDVPLGRNVASISRFVLPLCTDMQVSTNVSSSSRSM